MQDVIETLTAYEFIVARCEIERLLNSHYQDVDAAYKKMIAENG